MQQISESRYRTVLSPQRSLMSPFIVTKPSPIHNSGHHQNANKVDSTTLCVCNQILTVTTKGVIESNTIKKHHRN